MKMEVLMNQLKEAGFYFNIKVIDMNKLTYLILGLVIGIFTGCTKGLEREVAETYADGTPKTVRYFKQEGKNKILAIEEYFYPDGQLRMTGEFKNNKKEGHWISYYDNGNKWSEGFYKAGINEGKTTTWHENGEKYYEGYYKKGERAGTWKFWDDKGIFVKEIEYPPYVE